jgi:DNA-binding transcriptional regulator LsrR (DeoR family)
MKPKPNTPSVRRTRSPKDLQTTPNISKRQHALLARIASADAEQGCRASNLQFTKLLKISERQLRRDLAALRERKLITVRIESGNERSIRLKGRRPPSRPGRRA